MIHRSNTSSKIQRYNAIYTIYNTKMRQKRPKITFQHELIVIRRGVQMDYNDYIVLLSNPIISTTIIMIVIFIIIYIILHY